VAQVNSPATAGRALAAVAEYFSCNEPSNPALLLVKQAQALLGKSFLEVIQALVPDHLAKAAVNIGNEQYFPLPVQRLSAAAGAAEGAAAAAKGTGQGDTEVQFEVRSRTEALRLLDQIGRYFSTAEPPSPIPFFTERASDLATRDFLSVLKTMLPADALKTLK
jgi:type VI secretion system protein ImpA